MEQQVAIVRYISECDVTEISNVERMSYKQAVAELQEIKRVAAPRLAEFDIVYVQENGTLGPFASWAV
jgi:hypothetical protein